MSTEGPKRFELVCWERDDLYLELMPELGGKIRALRRRDSRRNVLLEPPERTWAHPAAGDAFDAYDTSGWDECFPTVAAVGSVAPDHGDTWSARATWHTVDDGLVTEVYCPSVDCRFRRTHSIRGSTLTLDYAVTSRSSEPRSVIWSAHPLLAVSPGSRFFLPAEVSRFVVEWSSDGHLGGPREVLPWPEARRRRFDVVGPVSTGRAAKLFSQRLTTGYCAFWDADSDEHVEFRFDTERIPYVGLWICEGGWPGSGRPKHYTVAMEPCMADCDSLAEACARGTAVTVPPEGTLTWTVHVTLGRGRPAPPTDILEVARDHEHR